MLEYEIVLGSEWVVRCGLVDFLGGPGRISEIKPDTNKHACTVAVSFALPSHSLRTLAQTVCPCTELE